VGLFRLRVVVVVVIRIADLPRFPKPVVLGVTGHALALGAVLLLAADRRIGARNTKSKYGLNEVAIGMVLPAFGRELARHRMPGKDFDTAVMQASVYDWEGALQVGYLDTVVDGDVAQAALAEAERLGKYLKQPAFQQTKELERKIVADRILGEIDADIPMPPTESWVSKL